MNYDRGFPGFRPSVRILFVVQIDKHNFCTIRQICRLPPAQIDEGFGARACREDAAEHQNDEPKVKNVRPVPPFSARFGEFTSEPVEGAYGQVHREDRRDKQEQEA